MFGDNAASTKWKQSSCMKRESPLPKHDEPNRKPSETSVSGNSAASSYWKQSFWVKRESPLPNMLSQTTKNSWNQRVWQQCSFDLLKAELLHEKKVTFSRHDEQSHKKLLKPECLAVVLESPRVSQGHRKKNVHSLYILYTICTLCTLTTSDYLCRQFHEFGAPFCLRQRLQSPGHLADWWLRNDYLIWLRPWLQFEVFWNPTLVGWNPHESNLKQGDSDRKMHSQQEAVFRKMRARQRKHYCVALPGDKGPLREAVFRKMRARQRKHYCVALPGDKGPLRDSSPGYWGLSLYWTTMPHRHASKWEK